MKLNGSEHTRMAFLDLMLDMLDKGEMDMDGIQEEVDTFTFEVVFFDKQFNDPKKRIKLTKIDKKFGHKIFQNFFY